jgi:hypothetical protein
VEATKPSAIYNVPAAEQAQVRDMNGNQEVDDKRPAHRITTSTMKK